MDYHTVRTFMNFLALQKYGIFFMLLLLFFPFLSMISSSPLYSLFAGLFLEVSAWELFWLSLTHQVASMTLMFNQGIISEEAERTPPVLDFGPQPEKLSKFFNIEVTWHQLISYLALALVGDLWVLFYADVNFFLGIGIIFGATVLCLVLTAVACAPMVLLYPGFNPLPDPCGELIRSCGSVFRKLPLKLIVMSVKASLDVMSKVINHLPTRFKQWLKDKTYHLRDEQGRFRPGHYFAMSNFTMTAILLTLASYLLYPMRGIGAVHSHYPGAISFFFVTVALMIWITGALQFHCGRFRISPLFVLVLVCMVGYVILDIDHYFEVKVVPRQQELGPVEVVKAREQYFQSQTGQEPENLVVVTCTGGGILAAAWFTLAMEQLITERPELQHEINLFSTVSGGSVGAAFYMHEARNNLKLETAELAKTFKNATTSSLVASAYGLAMLDTPRLASLGLLPYPARYQDRGTLLEEAWSYTANREFGIDESVNSFSGDIRQGKLPGFILSATAMEVGRRVMITPLTFPKLDRPYQRAQTLSEFYFETNSTQQADLSIWTGARMSASFPYVAPAARPRFSGGDPKDFDKFNPQKFHLIDGGYYDNFGVTSMLDWLTPVLEARRNDDGSMKFKRVAIIQLRAFELPDPNMEKPANGGAAALIGPLLGVTSAYSGAAITRNDINLREFIANWNILLGGKVKVGTWEFTRPDQGGPLSWHLTKREIEEVRNFWPPLAEAKREIRDNWQALNRFLEGKDDAPPASEPAQEAAPPAVQTPGP